MKAFTLTITVCFDEDAITQSDVSELLDDEIEGRIIEEFEVKHDATPWIPHSTAVEGDRVLLPTGGMGGPPRFCHKEHDMNTPSNSDRAERARMALTLFASATGLSMNDEPDTVFVDLLCDMMHLADSMGIDFGACLTGGKGHYDAEASIFD